MCCICQIYESGEVKSPSQSMRTLPASFRQLKQSASCILQHHLGLFLFQMPALSVSRCMKSTAAFTTESWVLHLSAALTYHFKMH